MPSRYHAALRDFFGLSVGQRRGRDIDERRGRRAVTRSLVVLFAFCCGAIVANLYYAQPIIGLIAPDIGLSPRAAGLIVSLTQVGYALGLFFLVPLGDLLENRRLMMVTTGVCVVALAAIAMTHDAHVFLALALLVGVSSVCVQIMIPLAANLAPAASRGRVVGGVMSGLAGRHHAGAAGLELRCRSLRLARRCSAPRPVVALFVEIVLALTMPKHQPAHKASYGQLIGSLWTMLRERPVLRRRSFIQACMFASFTLFWTAAPLELSHTYAFSQTQIALFALIGAMGAISAPIAGRLADAGHTRVATLSVSLVGAILCYMPGIVHPAWGWASLMVTGVAIDFCVQMNMVLGQREIYALDATSRGRMNAVYMTSLFIGGAFGAALASALFTHGGWAWAATAGAVFPVLSLIRLQQFLSAPRH